MKRKNLGISMISLVITIIVIIIIVSISMFGGMGAVKNAQLTTFVSDIDSVSLVVEEAYILKQTNQEIFIKRWTDAQIYESIATGETDVNKLNGTKSGLVLIDTVNGSVKSDLPKYEGADWYISLVDKGESLKVGQVVLYPGFFNEGEVYYSKLDIQNGGAKEKLQSPTDDSIYVSLNGEKLQILESSQIHNEYYKSSSNIKEVVKAVNGTIEVPIPIGCTYADGTGEEGLVIKDEKDNEWVWIPVPDPTAIYGEVAEGAEPLNLCGTTGVTTRRWGKSPVLSQKPGQSTDYREPDIVTTYDTAANISYMNLAGAANLNEFATNMVNEFNDMIDSIIKYKGFFVGRYELRI